MTLAGRTAAVTGASGAIGSAISKALNELGAHVVAIDIAENVAEGTSSSSHDKFTRLHLDLSDPKAIASASSKLIELFGSIDILVNNAGVLSNDKINDTTLEEWRRVVSINLEAAFLLIRSFLPGMRARKWGRIINMSSYAAKSGGLTANSLFGLEERAHRSYLRDRERDGGRRHNRQCDRAGLCHVADGVRAADGGAASSSTGANSRWEVLQTRGGRACAATRSSRP
jgi:NAD(P)-dependent dehydrogenase (short-subunit alcohol dehydrogenase family)